MATYTGTGAPTSGTRGTQADKAQLGDLYVDYTNTEIYVCTAVTASSGTTGPGTATAATTVQPTWAVTWTQAT